MQSVTPSIQQTGAVIQWSADTTEHAHIKVIKDPVTTTNNQNYDIQICCTLDCDEKCCLFNTIDMLSKPTNIGGTPTGDDAKADQDGDDVPSTEVGNDLTDNVLEDMWSAHCSSTNLFIAAEKLAVAPPGSAPTPFHTLAVGRTALQLNYKPSVRRITIDDAANDFNLPDRPSPVCPQLLVLIPTLH